MINNDFANTESGTVKLFKTNALMPKLHRSRKDNTLFSLNINHFFTIKKT